MNKKEIIKYCYFFESDLKVALKKHGLATEFEQFKIFVNLADEGFINVSTMERNWDVFYNKANHKTRMEVLEKFNKIEELNFKKLKKMIH